MTAYQSNMIQKRSLLPQRLLRAVRSISSRFTSPPPRTDPAPFMIQALEQRDLFSTSTEFPIIDASDAEITDSAVEVASLTTDESATFGKTDNGSNQKTELTDADGSLITIALKGPGTGTATLAGDRWDIQLEGTTHQSTLTIKVKAGDGFASIGNITMIDSGASLKAINASHADIIGNITIPGTLNKLKAHNLSGGSLTIGSNDRALSLIAADVSDFSILAHGGMKKLSIDSWTDTDATADQIHAPFIQTLKSRGDLSVLVATPQLNRLAIGGDLSDTTIMIGADLGQDRELGGSGVNADTFTIANTRSVRIKGTMRSSTVSIGYNPTTDTVVGEIDSRVNSIAVGSIDDGSRFVAGRFPTRVKVGNTRINPLLDRTHFAGALPVVQPKRIPKLGTHQDLRGRVFNTTPGDYKVATYIEVNGLWWVKPYADQPSVPVKKNGRFKVDVTTGGTDEFATSIAVFIVDDGFDVPVLLGRGSLPSSLFSAAESVKIIDR